MTPEEIDCCRRIGRDTVNNVSTIGLPELDALCNTADIGARNNDRRKIDRAFYKLTLAQRDSAWRECEKKQSRIEILEGLVTELAALTGNPDNLEKGLSTLINECLVNCDERDR